MVDFSYLVKFDKLNPISKFTYLCDNNIVVNKSLCHNILLALKAIDEVISNDLKGKCFLYLQDDLSVKWVIENALNCKFDNDEFTSCLYFIDFSKLVYRFTCAKKFKVKDSTINQLRINSWGRVYLDQISDEELNEKYIKFCFAFKKYYDENREIYLRLESLVSNAITESSAEEIQNLNNGIKIQILS